jgi:hypothetical protein
VAVRLVRKIGGKETRGDQFILAADDLLILLLLDVFPVSGK